MCGGIWVLRVGLQGRWAVVVDRGRHIGGGQRQGVAVAKRWLNQREAFPACTVLKRVEAYVGET